MERDPEGRLGVKIGGTPSGVYVDRIDWGVARLIQGSLQVMEKCLSQEKHGRRERNEMVQAIEIQCKRLFF